MRRGAGFYLRRLLCLLCITFGAAGFAQAETQGWTNWGQVADNQGSALDWAWRKGTNSFNERGTIFLRFQNRYKVQIYAEVTFDIVNVSKGTRTSTSAGTSPGPGKIDEQYGNWYTVPGNIVNPDEWSRTQVAVENMRFKFLKMKASDGSFREVYPNNEMAQWEQAQAEKRRQEEQRKQERAQAEQRREQENRREQEKRAADRRSRSGSGPTAESANDGPSSSRGRSGSAGRTGSSAGGTQRQGGAEDPVAAALRSQNEFMERVQKADREVAEKAKAAEDKARRDREQAEERFNADLENDPDVRNLLKEIQGKLKRAADHEELAASTDARAKVNKEDIAAMGGGWLAAAAIIANAKMEQQVQGWYAEARNERAEAKRLEQDIVDLRRRKQKENRKKLDKAERAARKKAETTTETVEQSETPSPTPVIDVAVQHYNAGYKMFGENKFAEAASEFGAAAKLNPADPKIQYWLGKSLVGLQRYPEAETALREAIRLNPNDVAPRSVLGEMYADQARHADAVQEYRRFLAVYPGDRSAAFGFASALAAWGISQLPGDWEWAETRGGGADFFLKERPAYMEAYSTAPPPGEDAIREAAEAFDSFYFGLSSGADTRPAARVHRFLAHCLSPRGSVQEVVAEYKRAIELYEEHWGSGYVYSLSELECYAYQHQLWSDVEYAASRLDARTKVSAIILADLAEAQLRQGNRAEAMVNVDRAMKQRPGWYDHWAIQQLRPKAKPAGKAAPTTSRKKV